MKRANWYRRRGAIVKETRKPLILIAWKDFLAESRLTKLTREISAETGISMSAINNDLAMFGLNQRQHSTVGNDEWRALNI
jgi:hypothetical protein